MHREVRLSMRASISAVEGGNLPPTVTLLPTRGTKEGLDHAVECNAWFMVAGALFEMRRSFEADDQGAPQ